MKVDKRPRKKKPYLNMSPRKDRTINCSGGCGFRIFYAKKYDGDVIHGLKWLISLAEKGVYERGKHDDKTEDFFRKEHPIKVKRMVNCFACGSGATTATSGLTKNARMTIHLKCFDCHTTMFIESRFLYVMKLLEHKPPFIESTKPNDTRTKFEDMSAPINLRDD